MAEAPEPYVARCPIGCASVLEMTTIRLPEGNLRRCSECGQLVSQVGESAYWQSMRQFDQDEYNLRSSRQDQRHFSVARRRLSRISALVDKEPAQTSVLDVGCSRGQFLEAGLELGFDMQGVEPAANVARAARAAGLRVHAGLLEEVRFPDASFDAVTLFEVIEHLRDPPLLLNECHRVLRPGGILLLSTGNAASWTARAMGGRWDYFHIAKDGGHISFYNPFSIALLAARSRYDVARLETARVKFYERGEVANWRYTASKLAAELLNLPARAMRRGHDMLVYLRRA